MTIVVCYTSVDGVYERKVYKTLTGARKYASDRVGAHADFGSSYAISDDGIGKISVQGCTLADLFPSDHTTNPQYTKLG